MKKHKNSRQGKIEFENLKTSSRHVFKQRDHNAKLKATTRQEHRKQLIDSVSMVIAINVNLFLER